MVEEYDLVKGAGKGGEEAPCRYSGAAAEIGEGAGGRGPVAEGEFAEDGVPFPADAFAEGAVVVAELAEGGPVGAFEGCFGEEEVAEFAEIVPVNGVGGLAHGEGFRG